MNIPTEKELVELLERCWNAATKAKISNGPMHFEQNDQMGRSFLDTLRCNTFNMLVTNLLPRLLKEKEPWEDN